MLFITVASASAEHVPKVLQVVEEAKRLRHKNGQDDDELYQYVRYDTERQKGPRRINLDDDKQNKNQYKPPSSLTVHLSKIPMPELQPKAQADERKGKREIVHRKSYSDHSSNKHNTNDNSSSSLSVPKPSVLARRKRSSPALSQQSRSSSSSTSSRKNSEPSSPQPAGSPYSSTSSSNTKRPSYYPASPAAPQMAPPPHPPLISTQSPPERPLSTNFLFDFLRR